MPAHPSSPTAPTLAAAGRAASHDHEATALTHLAVEGLSFGYPDRRVLSDVSFTARSGDRIGLIGENGTGKSTLLRLISGAGSDAVSEAAAALTPEAGTVSVPGSIGLLEQQLPYPAETPLSRVLDDAQRDAVESLERLESIGARYAEHPDDPRLAEAYAGALEAAERSAAWSAEAKRGETVAGLGLGGIAETRTIGQLSGGQQLRLSLAALLLRAPHTLLLDEPSNHLDDASAAYLERVLAAWPGIVIFASHDRALLDAVATKILDLDALPVPASMLEADSDEDPGSGLGVRLWGVGYSAARSARAEEMRRWRERYLAETERLAELEHEIEVGAHEVNRKHESKSESRITRKFYADKDARVTARRARNARVRLDTLERERVRRPPEPLRFRGFDGFPASDGADTARPAESGAASRDDAELLLAANRVSMPGRLSELSLELHEGERLLLAGPNGAGKSTLLAILAGSLQPASGEVGRFARMGYLPQEVSFAEPARSAAELYRAAVGEERAERLPLEATGLLAPRDAGRAVGELSIGQRRRVALAILVADAPPVLLLDEPTNHLSLSLVEELEEALRRYPGALAIASHDRWLRSRWDGRVLRLDQPTPA